MLYFNNNNLSYVKLNTQFLPPLSILPYFKE